jgi:hypothetical protein
MGKMGHSLNQKAYYDHAERGISDDRCKDSNENDNGFDEERGISDVGKNSNDFENGLDEESAIIVVVSKEHGEEIENDDEIEDTWMKKKVGDDGETGVAGQAQYINDERN